MHVAPAGRTVPEMLKITSHTNAAGERTLILEGQITGSWVTELRAAHADAIAAGGDRVTVDLKDVIFIDGRGVEFFEEIATSVALINCSLFAAEQLKNVLTRHRRVQG
jgi:anti-anti-sigma regulatory factor